MDMDIVYLGHASFRLKGKTKTVVIDPYGEKMGKYPRDVEADVLLVSHDHVDHNATDKVHGTPFLIDGPGEFEVGGVSVVGVPSFHDDENGVKRGTNTIFVIEMDGLRVVHLGDVGHKLTDDILEEIGSVDVALVPVGGVYTLDAKMAKEVTGQLDPWMVIPMHYKMPGCGLDDIAPVDEFLKEMGKPDVQPVPKLTVTADRLPEELQVVVLEKKS
jgi:L-ascorbate metabolism protein UlaG (beta-lactamase superfamily)